MNDNDDIKTDKMLQTIKEKYGSVSEYYAEKGRRNAGKSKPSGFGSDKIGRDGMTGKDRASIAGQKGGRDKDVMVTRNRTIDESILSELEAAINKARSAGLTDSEIVNMYKLKSIKIGKKTQEVLDAIQNGSVKADSTEIAEVIFGNKTQYRLARYHLVKLYNAGLLERPGGNNLQLNLEPDESQKTAVSDESTRLLKRTTSALSRRKDWLSRRIHDTRNKTRSSFDLAEYNALQFALDYIGDDDESVGNFMDKWITVKKIKG